MNENSVAGRNWESFWAREPVGGAALIGGGATGFLNQWWRRELAMTAIQTHGRRTADLACGAGVLAKLASAYFEELGSPVNDLICIDYSVSALRAATVVAHAKPIVADLAAIPLPNGSLDIVLSQFGVEYAGDAGILEAARIVAQGGVLLALVHDAHGALAAECRDNLALFDDALETRIFGFALGAFQAGFAADRGAGSREALSDAFGKLQSAMRSFDGVIRRPNSTIAMAFLRKVRQDLTVMFNRRRAYDEADIERWVASVSSELIQSRDRFAAMLRAARDEANLKRLCAQMSESGLSVEPAEKVVLQNGASIGWRLRLRRI